MAGTDATVQRLLIRRAGYMISKNVRFPPLKHTIGITAIKFTYIPRTRSSCARVSSATNDQPPIHHRLTIFLVSAAIFLFCHNGTEIFIYCVITIASRPPYVGVITVSTGSGRRKKDKSDIFQHPSDNALSIADRIFDCAETTRAHYIRLHATRNPREYLLATMLKRSSFSEFSENECFIISAHTCLHNMYLYSDWNIICEYIFTGKKIRNAGTILYTAVYSSPLRGIDGNVGVNIKYVIPSSGTNMRFHISCNEPIYLRGTRGGCSLKHTTNALSTIIGFDKVSSLRYSLLQQISTPSTFISAVHG